jgi:hypothetical protein
VSNLRNIFSKDDLRAQAHHPANILAEGESPKPVDGLSGLNTRILVDDSVNRSVHGITPNGMGQFVTHQNYPVAHRLFAHRFRNTAQSAADVIDARDRGARLDEFPRFLARSIGVLSDFAKFDDIESPVKNALRRVWAACSDWRLR